MINHADRCDVQTTGACTCPVDRERIRAAIRMLYPDEMTPTAKRALERILDSP